MPLYGAADEPFILLDIAPSRTYFTRILDQAGITPKLAFASPSLEVVRGLVGPGLGYSILVTRPMATVPMPAKRSPCAPSPKTVERGVIALAALKQMRKTRLVSAFEAHCIDYFKTTEHLT